MRYFYEGNIMQTISDIIRNYKSIIYDKLLEYLYLDNFKEIPKNYQEIKSFHLELCSDYPQRGGKFLRSVILILMAEAFGGSVDHTLQTATAIEISQNWLLIHDDIMDGSLLRRGQPTLNRKYNNRFAVNAGDSLQVIMWKILRDNEFVIGVDKSFRVIDEFIKILERTTFGQTAELWFSERNILSFSESDYYFIVDGKTSCYTISGPMRLGAIVGNSDFESLNKTIFPILDNIGKCFGRAFQIIDDVLNITSDFDGLKEKRGSDIVEGKRTLLLIHLLNNCTKDQREKVCNIMNESQICKSQEDIEYIIDLFSQMGSIDYAFEKAKDWSKRGFYLFKQCDFLINTDAKEKLLAIMDYLVNRTH